MTTALNTAAAETTVTIAPAEAARSARWWRDQLRRRMLAGADAITALALGAVLLANGDAFWAWIAVPVPVALVAAKLLGLYDNDHRAIRHLTVDEVPQLIAFVAATLITTLILTPGAAGDTVFVATLAAGVALSAALRGTARTVWRKVTPAERTLVVGEGLPSEAIRRKIELFDDMHMELVRDILPLRTEPANGNDPLEDALEGVDRVVLAWSQASPAIVERLLEICRRRQAKLSVVSPFQGRARPSQRLSMVADLPVLEYNTWDVPRSTRALKRALDVGVSGLLLIVLAPLIALIALAIKLDDRGPVFFKQMRAGRKGEPFRMVKFRTMSVDAERRLDEVVRLADLSHPMFKMRRDPRVTRVGRVLRRASLDEIPQLWNVLRGEMSLVGPRPEELRLVERYRPEDRFRLEMTPGITGPMQVFGRGELTFPERLAVELDYMENLSLARDIGLLARTLAVVVRGKGAF